MKSPYSFIVSPKNGRRYDNIKKYGNKNFITSSSEEDHSSSNRFAVVVSTPINYIKPLESKDGYLKKSSKYEPLTGTVKYINQDLLDKGVKVGDVVLYQPDSEYEFLVDDELLYRMFTDNITVVL